MSNCKAHSKPVCGNPPKGENGTLGHYRNYCHDEDCRLPTSDELLAAIPPPDLAAPAMPQTRQNPSPLDGVPELVKVYIEAGGTGPLIPCYVLGKIRKHDMWWYLCVPDDGRWMGGNWISEKGIRHVE